MVVYLEMELIFTIGDIKLCTQFEYGSKIWRKDSRDVVTIFSFLKFLSPIK